MEHFTVHDSFRAPQSISGETLADAIRANIGKLCEDHGVGRYTDAVTSVHAEFRPSILGGRGGVEVTIRQTRPGRVEKQAAAWIYAAPDDLSGEFAFEFAGSY